MLVRKSQSQYSKIYKIPLKEAFMKMTLAVLVTGLLIIGSSAFAADGDLVVNGNLCVGGNCTSTLHVSGGLYGYCKLYISTCKEIKNPSECIPPSYPNIYAKCGCPSGYTVVQLGADGNSNAFYSCYKD
jgi:hypothetical protein